jgi:hypothetical protein
VSIFYVLKARRSQYEPTKQTLKLVPFCTTISLEIETELLPEILSGPVLSDVSIIQ